MVHHSGDSFRPNNWQHTHTATPGVLTAVEIQKRANYNSPDTIYKFVRKIFSLPFLPEEQIVPTFNRLKEKATEEKLVQLMTYVETTWITNQTWLPSVWTVFQRSIRTNNDVEGWHYRVNRRAKKSNLAFYIIVTLLYQEAKALPAQMVSEGKLRRNQTKKTKQLQGQIFSLWALYTSGQLSVNSMLKKCSKLYRPG